MRPIDADALCDYILDGKLIGLTICQYSESDILYMIKHQPTIAPPSNDPLTLEELREMDGEPIYITGIGWKICYGVDESTVQPGIITGLTTRLYLHGYGKTWFAYRRKPEEGTA